MLGRRTAAPKANEFQPNSEEDNNDQANGNVTFTTLRATEHSFGRTICGHLNSSHPLRSEWRSAILKSKLLFEVRLNLRADYAGKRYPWDPLVSEKGLGNIKISFRTWKIGHGIINNLTNQQRFLMVTVHYFPEIWCQKTAAIVYWFQVCGSWISSLDWPQ